MQELNLTNDKLLDISFRKQLRTNPKDVLKSFDIDQLDYDVKVVSNSKNTIFFVFPDRDSFYVAGKEYIDRIQVAGTTSTGGSLGTVSTLGSLGTFGTSFASVGSIASAGTASTASTNN